MKDLFLFWLFWQKSWAFDGEDAKILGEIEEKDLAVHFAVHGSLPVLQQDRFTWVCTTMKLRPEDADEKFLVKGDVKYPWAMPSKFVDMQRECNKNGGVYARLDKVTAFVDSATGHAAKSLTSSMDETCPTISMDGMCSTGGQMIPDLDNHTLQGSELAKVIKSWNRRFFDMYDPATRRHTDTYHGRGSEEKHLTMQVSFFQPPEGVGDRLRQRLLENKDAFFSHDGAGKAGTTGANFIAGNVGFGNENQGADLMSLLFPSGKKDSALELVGSCVPKVVSETTENCWIYTSMLDCVERSDDRCNWIQPGIQEDGTDADVTGMASDDRRQMQGEMVTDTRDNHSSPPDMALYEQEMINTITSRSDVRYLFGAPENMEFQFQHRLWRFGPDFPSKSKGGIWHRDTCPFGINGAIPAGGIMFTLVYIIYTENLDLPSAGTRVKDPVTGEIFQLPCEAGRGNMIRSGEDDAHTFYHSGPLDIKKVDKSRPAYRVMMQSKAVVLPKGGRKQTIPNAGLWQGLNITPLHIPEEAGSETKIAKLNDWLLSTSKRITYGIGESNALGSSAYPINVQRAWTVTRDMAAFLGFDNRNSMPQQDSVSAPVVMFGFDHYSYDVVRLLQEHNFRVSTTATEAMYDHLYRNHQDGYANIHTMDILRESSVEGLLLNEPFDMHLVIDAAPGSWAGASNPGKYSADPTLAKYGVLLEKVAARPPGYGRVLTVTYLSQLAPPESSKEQCRQAENEWIRFGEEFKVRVVIMRVAHRVYGKWNSALGYSTNVKLYSQLNPCRVAACSRDEPLTRINAEDLAHIVLRMLSMFDMVENHGRNPALQGTASMESSLARFPSGLILDMLDDGVADSMKEAEVWGAILVGKLKVGDVCSTASSVTFTPPPAAFSTFNNSQLKQKLAYEFMFPTYRHGAAKLFANGEYL